MIEENGFLEYLQWQEGPPTRSVRVGSRAGAHPAIIVELLT